MSLLLSLYIVVFLFFLKNFKKQMTELTQLVLVTDSICAMCMYVRAWRVVHEETTVQFQRV